MRLPRGLWDFAFIHKEGYSINVRVYTYMIYWWEYIVTEINKGLWHNGGEETLFKHPYILEAAVAGIPDEKWGEVGKAFIVLKPGKQLTSDEVFSYLQGKLAKYKIPKQYEFRDELPKSAAGKILKRELFDRWGV